MPTKPALLLDLFLCVWVVWVGVFYFAPYTFGRWISIGPIGYSVVLAVSALAVAAAYLRRQTRHGQKGRAGE